MTKTVVRAGFLLISVLILTTVSQVAKASDIRGSLTKEPAGALLTLTWQEPSLTYTATTGDRELLLSFSGPVHMKVTQNLVSKGSGLIEDLVVSYDTLFLKTPVNVVYKLTAPDRRTVHLRLKRTGRQTAGTVSSSTRLKLIKAKLLFKKGETDEALALISQIQAEQPENTSVLLAKADILLQSGRRKEALELAQKAKDIDPANTSARAFLNRVAPTTQPFIKIETAQRDTADHLVEHINRIQVETRPLPHWALGIKLSTYDPKSDVAGAEPELENESGQAEIYSLYEWDGGSTVGLTLFINTEADPGMGGDYIWRDADSALTLGLDYNRPKWEYFITQIEAEHWHRIRIELQEAITAQFRLTMFTAYNQNVLEDEDQVPASISARIGAFYDLPGSDGLLGANSYLSVGYEVDAEAPLDVKEEGTITKSAFKRQVQSPRIDAGKQLGDWDLSGYLGYAFRHYEDDSGGFGGIRLRYEPADTLDLYLSLDRIVDENSYEVNLIIIGLKWII